MQRKALSGTYYSHVVNAGADDPRPAGRWWNIWRRKKNVILSKPQLSGYSGSYFPAFLPYDQCDIPILSHHPILTSIVGCSRVTYVAPRVTVQMYCSPKLNFRRMATRYVCSATIDHLICVRLRQGGLSIPNICSRTTTRCFLLLCYSTGQILFWIKL